MKERGAGPLAGLRVIESGAHTATPMLGMLLADQGADVVRVERPGEPARPGHPVWNRGKAVLVLDLDAPADRAHARDLATRADVWIDGHRPRSLARRGLGAESLRAENARLITCGLPGFAAEDPRAHLPAWEGAVGALAGLYERPWRRRPTYSALPLAPFIAALYAAAGIAGALLARDRDQVGQHVEVPIYDATFALQALTALLTIQPPRAWRTARWGATPFIGPRRCADGRWLHLHVASSAHLDALLRALEGCGHHAEARALHALASGATLADPTSPSTVREANQIRAALDRLFATAPAATWEARLADAGVSAALVRSAEEWLAHPHARDAGTIVTVEDPHLGPLEQPGLGVSGGRVAPRATAPTSASALLRRWTAAPAQLSLIAGATAPPLEGARVLELGPPGAGAAAARTLAELGAQVVRVEDPRLCAPALDPLHVMLNQGKRSVSLDLRTPDGRHALWRMAERHPPDFVIESHHPGALDALGMGESAFREHHPHVVWVRVSAWGSRGPWARRPGWEHTVQAATGIAADLGGEGPPEILPMPVATLGAGLLAAFGAMLARRTRGAPPTVHTSLAAAATLLQSPWLYKHPGRVVPRRPDPTALGDGPLHRFYRARDGWMFLAAPPEVAEQVARVRGLDALAGLPFDAWESALEQALAKAAVYVWQARFAHAGLEDRVAIVHRTRPRAAMGDPRALHRDLVRYRAHPGIGWVTETGQPLSLSRTPTVHLGPAPPCGADTRPVLASYGLPIPPSAPPIESAIPDPPRDLAAEVAWLGDQARWGLYAAWSRLQRARGPSS